jgi:hypothetical protein
MSNLNTGKYELFTRTFGNRRDIKPDTILKIADELSLTVDKSDIQPNISFLYTFNDSYPINKTTSKQFSLLMIFFSLRKTNGLEDNDSQHIDHLRAIRTALARKRELSSAQTDFWKWFNKQI